jgi:hypothetical protein
MSVFSNPQGRAESAARAYVSALLDLVGDDDPVSILAEGPKKLAEGTAGLSEERLRQPEREGKWSILDVVNHLADTELVFSFRIRITLAQDEPPITGFDQDAWVSKLGNRSGDLAEMLDRFRSVRHANVKLLRSCTKEELARLGMHAERGPESVELMMKLAAGHDMVHVRQIGRIRNVLGP